MLQDKKQAEDSEMADKEEDAPIPQAEAWLCTCSEQGIFKVISVIHVCQGLHVLTLLV